MISNPHTALKCAFLFVIPLSPGQAPRYSAARPDARHGRLQQPPRAGTVHMGYCKSVLGLLSALDMASSLRQGANVFWYDGHHPTGLRPDPAAQFP